MLLFRFLMSRWRHCWIATSYSSEVCLKTWNGQQQTSKSEKHQNNKKSEKAAKQMVADSQWSGAGVEQLVEWTVSWRSSIHKYQLEELYRKISKRNISFLWRRPHQILAGGCSGCWGSGRRGCRARRACSRWAELVWAWMQNLIFCSPINLDLFLQLNFIEMDKWM